MIQTPEVLTVCRTIRRRIKVERDRLVRLKDSRMLTSVRLTGMPHGDDTVLRLEKMSVAIMDCERSVYQLELILMECQNETIQLINKFVTDRILRAILIDKHVYGIKRAEIERKIGYSHQSIWRMTVLATEKFNEQWQKMLLL